MYTSRVVKTTTAALAFLLVSTQVTLALAQSTNLDVVVKKAELGLDLTQIESDGNYHQPRSIIVTPVFLAEGVKLDAREWYRGLFYYFSSERHNYKDLPAHYVLDQNGKLYEGIAGGVEREIIVKQAENAPILIFYLAERGETDFTLSAKATLERQLLKLANENSIKPELLEVASIKLDLDAATKQASLTKEPIFGNWIVSFKQLKERLAGRYAPTKKNYKVEVVEYKDPAAAVKVGSEVVLNLKIKNSGDYTIFSDSDSELLLTKADGQDSQLFLNNHWVSKTQAPILSSGTVLLPGAEKVFELKVKAPFTIGSHAEDFVIKTADGSTIENARIKISLNIDKGDLKILEVLSTETGTLNIRRDPQSSSPVVDKASPGQRYVWIETSNNGWYKLQLDSGTGWVLGRYVKVL